MAEIVAGAVVVAVAVAGIADVAGWAGKTLRTSSHGFTRI
jgi:hypothetical protein